MYCPNCKQEFDGKFCPECGTKLIEKTQRICPNCNIEVESKFCPECGAKTVEVVEKMVKMCPNCKIETESKFCPECGAKIVEMAVKTTVTGEIAAATSNKKSEKKKSDETANTKKTANAVADVKNDVVTYYNTAMEYHLGINGKKKNDKKAVEWYQKAAEMGLAEAQVQLAKCYMAGCGVKRNLDLTFEWYHKAAEQGNGWAQYALGHLYCHSFNPPNYPEMRKWYKKAEAQGVCELPGLPEPLSPEAIAKAAELQAAGTKVSVEKKSKATANKAEDAETCYQTAQDYQYGKNGKQQDDEAAAQWYLKAAEQGHVESYYCLGSMLKEVCELEDAIGCFQEAAELGHAAAQYELGVAYSLGLGIELNNEESMKWYRKAAEQGHEEAIGFLEELGERVPAGGEDGAEKWYLKAAEQGNEEAIEYQKKSLTNMDNKEIFCEIFEQYGSMVISSCLGESTFKEWLEGEVFEGTGCMLGQVHDMTLERFNTIAELFITHTDINVNDRQKLALMVLLYVVLWDNVGYSNLKIEYNGEVLIDKPEDEVFEEYKSYLEKIAEYVPAYEPEDSDDEDWNDEDCNDEWNDDEDEDDEWNNDEDEDEDEEWNDDEDDEDDEDIEGYEVEDGVGIIPDGTTEIEENAFYDREDLKSITIPSSVISIGEKAFLFCKNLTSIAIPSSVTSIGDWAFSGCSSLTSITIPSSVTSIGKGAFYDCESLTSITIPSSVISIGERAFLGCESLTSITIPSSVISIGERAFRGCRSLTSITIPSSVTSIGEGTFWECDNLTSITIPSSVTSIGDVAFLGCESLTSITIPSSVTSIGNDAFEGCSRLTSITIPSSVISIGEKAFRFCKNLTSITIPSSVTSIGNDAFKGCYRLTSITIPTHITNIDELDIPEETRIIRENV